MAAQPTSGWVTAGELAEYAYCPRAHHYAQVAPDAPVPAATARRQSAGDRFHATTSRAVVARAESGGAAWAWVVAGLLLLLLVGAVVGLR